MSLVFNGRCLDRPIGGVERYARMLLHTLARIHTDLRVVVPPKATADLGLPPGITVQRFGNMRGHAWEQLSLPSALRKGDFLLNPANAAPLRVHKQAVVVHDLAFLHHPEWFDVRFAKWYGFLMPLVVRRSAVVVTVSETMRQELITTFELPAEKVIVVPPYADPQQFSRSERVNVPDRFFLFVGGDDPRKSISGTLDQLFASDDQAHAVIVGRQRKPFSARPLPADARIHWLTDATDAQLTWLYDRAQALIHPSVYEGFGLPVLEALQRGCPVIARPLPVLLEQFGNCFHACPFAGSSDLSAVLPLLPLRTPGSHLHGEEVLRVLARFSEQHTEMALRSVIERSKHL
ncbi:MAG: glycosyltransferase family 4 protein [Flavobacteriales bacterium]|nr:glycosyltransferase family 4 protein [Flavobacteriales bacterium]